MTPSSLTRPVCTRLAPARAQRECRHEPLEPPCPATDSTAGDAAGCRRRLGASASGWIEALAADTAATPKPPQVVHSPLDVRGPEPDRHVRPQAWPRQQRALQAHRDDGAGDASRSALAEARPPGQGSRHHPLDELQGRGPRPGHLLPPDRLPAPGPGSLPDARLAGRQRVRRRVGRAAGVRQHLAGPGDQRGRLQLRLPRTEVRTVERRRAEPGGRPGCGESFAAGRRSRHPARHRPPPSRRTARADANIRKRLPGATAPASRRSATRVPTVGP